MRAFPVRIAVRWRSALSVLSCGVLDGIFLNRRCQVLVPSGPDVRDIHVPHVLNRPSMGDLPWVLGSSVKKYQPSKTMHEKTGRTDLDRSRRQEQETPPQQTPAGSAARQPYAPHPPTAGYHKFLKAPFVHNILPYKIIT